MPFPRPLGEDLRQVLKNVNALWLAAIIIGLAVLAVFLYRAAKPPESFASLKPTLPDQVLIRLEGDSRITATEEGRLSWSLVSDGLVYFQSPEVVEVSKLTAWIPARDGGTVEVDGDQGLFMRDTEDIFISGNVRVRMKREGSGKRPVLRETAEGEGTPDPDAAPGPDGAKRGAPDPEAAGVARPGEYPTGGERLSEWLVYGETASYRKAEEAFHISEVDGMFNPSSGGTVWVAGRRGRFDAREKKMKLLREVVCRYSQGTRLETDWLDYDMEENLATTKAPVRITGKGFRLEGVGLWADLAREQVVIEEKVRVKLDKKIEAPK